MTSTDKAKEFEKRDAKVLSALKKNKKGLTMPQLAEKSEIDSSLLRGSLKRLREAGRVETEGTTKSLKYLLA